MSDNNFVFYATTLGAAISLALIWMLRRPSGTKTQFPPGPRRLPLLGNVLDVPKDVPIWCTFAAVAKKFSMCSIVFSFPNFLFKLARTSEDSDVVYLRLFATGLVVLNSSEVISDLIEKRSDIYSGRVSPGASSGQFC